MREGFSFGLFLDQLSSGYNRRNTDLLDRFDMALFILGIVQIRTPAGRFALKIGTL